MRKMLPPTADTLEAGQTLSPPHLHSRAIPLALGRMIVLRERKSGTIKFMERLVKSMSFMVCWTFMSASRVLARPTVSVVPAVDPPLRCLISMDHPSSSVAPV